MGILGGTLFEGMQQVGSIIGLKGGGAEWMRENLGMGRMGGYTGFGGFSSAWEQGGFIGLGRHAKQWFGFGFDPTLSTKEMMPYLETVAGGKKLSRMMDISAAVRPSQRARLGARYQNLAASAGIMAEDARGVFGRRRIAGAAGLGGAALMGAATIGTGNMLTLGAGAGIGAVGVGIFADPMGRKLGSQKLGGYGRKMGGKIGLAAAGLGIMTGYL